MRGQMIFGDKKAMSNSFSRRPPATLSGNAEEEPEEEEEEDEGEEKDEEQDEEEDEKEEEEEDKERKGWSD